MFTKYIRHICSYSCTCYTRALNHVYAQYVHAHRHHCRHTRHNRRACSQAPWQGACLRLRVPDSVPLLDSSSLPSLDVLLPLQAEAPGEFVGVSQGGDLREEAEPLVEVGTNTPRLGEVGGERERVEGTYCF